MKKWLKDDNSIQLVDRELFQLPAESPDQYMVVLKYAKNKDGYSYQIGFNTGQSFDNNRYFINMFDDQDEYLGGFAWESQTAVPPVWNRDYIDYGDFLIMQKAINVSCERHNISPFEFDDSGYKTSFYIAKFDPESKSMEENLSRAKAGEIYQIISLFGEKATDLREQTKEMVRKLYDI